MSTSPQIGYQRTAEACQAIRDLGIDAHPILGTPGAFISDPERLARLLESARKALSPTAWRSVVDNANMIAAETSRT